MTYFQNPPCTVEDLSSIPGYRFATILDLDQVTPELQFNVYHGTSLVTADICEKMNGLPARGKDIELTRHVEPTSGREQESAFVGTVRFPVAPGYDAGAAFWAGAGGWVYHINEWPGYDINMVLEGRIPDGKGGFRGPLLTGEQEIAIPARVPRSNIVKIGVVQSRRGGLVVCWG